MRHFVGVLWRPRSTMAALIAAPAFLNAWLLVLVLWLLPAAWLLSTDVGQQALVDERVRLAEAFGGQVTDAQYQQWLASPPWLAYVAASGRLLLAPPTTVLVAIAFGWLARHRTPPLPAAAAMAVSVHALAPLALQQALSAPLSYLRESLASPTTLAAVVPVVDGSLAARWLGGIDVCAVWWLSLLAVGLSVATGSPARGHLARLLGAYVALVGGLAAAMAVAGGT